MPKELYLYSPIYSFAAESLISQMEDNSDDDVVMRVNSPGGSVFSGWGIIAKMREHTQNVKVKVDGVAASMAFFMALFADETEALDVSKFMTHRAYMEVESEEDQKFLDSVNKDLRSKMKAKLDGKKFKEITGVSIDQMFDSEERKDYWMSAKDAKAIGLIGKINKISSKANVAAINEKFYNVAAEAAPNPTTMSEEKPPKENPEAGFNEGVQAERSRIAGWNAWLETDPEAVKKGIESGKEITSGQREEFIKKSTAKAVLEAIEKGNAQNVDTKDATAAATEDKVYIENGKEIKVSAEKITEGNAQIKAAREKAKQHLNPNYKAE